MRGHIAIDLGQLNRSNFSETNPEMAILQMIVVNGDTKIKAL